MKATRAPAIAIVVPLCCLIACSGPSLPAPPKPLAAPTKVADLTGIWRTFSQNVLELRSNGTFVLITPTSAPMAGDYTLSQDSVTFFDTKGCGDAQGTYRVQVSLKERMQLSEPDDACGPRKSALSDPLVYDQPDFS